MIIGVVGTLASGKSTVARMLEGEGFTRLSLSDLLREEAARQNLEDTRETLLSIANQLRERYGPGAIMQEALNKMQDGEDYVVDAIRNLSEIGFLRERTGARIIGVDADQDVRFSRARERQTQTGRDEGASSKEEFQRRDTRDGDAAGHRPPHREVLEAADVIIWNNAGLDELRNEVRQALVSFKKDPLPSDRPS